MNVREQAEPTASGRIAAVIIRSFRNMIRSGRCKEIDYADIRDAISVQVSKEAIRARILEARECQRPDRVNILQKMLSE